MEKFSYEILKKKYKWACIAFLFFLSFKIIKCDFSINDFSHNVLSMASANNVDMQNLIIAYSLFVFPGTFIVAYFIYKSKLYKLLTGVMNFNIKSFEMFILVLLSSNLFLAKNVNWLFIFIGIVNICFIFLNKFDEIKISSEKLVVVWLTYLISFSIPVFTLGQMFTYFASGLYVLFLLLSLFISFKQVYQQNKYIYYFMWIFLMAGVIDVVLLVIFEMCVLRGEHAILPVLLIPHIVSIVYLKWKKFAIEEKNYYGVSYLYLSAIILTVSVIPPLGASGYIDFFEGANHGISIYEAINGLGIPIIDNLDAHMLSATLSGILYSYLTGDTIGALFALPYGVFIHLSAMLAIILLFKEYIDYSRIFCLLVFFPWSGMSFILMGFIGIFVFAYWLRKPNVYKSVLIVLLFIIFSFYRIDIGASFGLALLLMPFLVYFLQNNMKGIILYIAIICVVISFSFLVAYAVWENLGKDIFVTLRDIYFAFSSNQHWGYGVFGNNVKAYILYIVIPCINAVLFIPVAKRIYAKETVYCDCIAIFTYIVYFLSIPRSVVRHTLIENSPCAYAIPAILLLVLLLPRVNKNSRSLVTVGILSFIVCSMGSNTRSYFLCLEHNMPTLIASVNENAYTYWKLNEEDAKQIDLSKEFCDYMLEKDETYFDFTNQSLFYVFNKRNNPVYVNQSPAMINSVRENQEIVVNRLESIMPKFVFMPFLDRQGYGYGCYYSIDGIQNIDRYFLISEFISENYRPFCSVGNFAVWCKKDDYEAMIADEKYNKFALDYNYALDTKHYLGEIPYLWEYCSSNVYMLDNRQFIKKYNDVYIIKENDNVFAQKGFLVLTVESLHDVVWTMKLSGNNIQNIEYTFNVKKGVYNYRIRLSSDWRWFSNDLHEMRIFSEANDVIIKSMEFQRLS